MLLKSIRILITILLLVFVKDGYQVAEIGENIKESILFSKTGASDAEMSFKAHSKIDSGSIESDIDSQSLTNITRYFESSKRRSNINSSIAYVSCLLNKSYFGKPFEIVNASKLASLVHVIFTEPNMTYRQIPGNCVIVLFYSPSCLWSCAAAPHFNALPRFFPDLKFVAFDALKYRSISAQFGIIGTPTLMLFHNRKPIAKFNETSEYGLNMFANFITKFTGIEPEGELMFTSEDFYGPISPVPIEEPDFCLKLSLLIIVVHLLYFLYNSAWGRNLMDATLNAWREAEAQHHHHVHHHHHMD